MRRFLLRLALGATMGPVAAGAMAAGGPLGIDHELAYDNSGIWARRNQLGLQYGLIGADLAVALWEGGDSRLGKTAWESLDATVATAVTTEALKRTFTRARPIQDQGPDAWFQGGSHYSFPSGEVASVSAVVAPYVFEYGPENPAAYLLELLPAYDAVARMKVQAHWQTDVLAGWLIGTGWGWFTHSRSDSVLLDVMPNGIRVGIRKQF